MPDATVLTDVAKLADAKAGGRPPTVLDVRWRLGGPPGYSDYLAGHIPGAVFLDLDAQVCGQPGAAGRHPLPDPLALQKVLRAAGLQAGRPIVTYDGGDGNAAARLWWTLRWAGLEQVTVLDGGFSAWAAAGQPVVAGPPAPTAPGDVVVRPGGMPMLDAAAAATVAGAGVLLDARVPARYRGEIEPIDPVAGRIPGAVNLPDALLTAADGRLRGAAELRDLFASVGVGDGTAVGAYCGSGVTAARTVLALTVAGVGKPALYIGSWSHWITDADRPVATGESGSNSAGDLPPMERA